MTLRRISIIIPVYNTELYVEDCMKSLLAQTNKNFEIVIVNDGSTDNSINIINDYRSKFNNIKVINQANSGLSSARNTGIKNSEGEYIIFLDSDDMLSKNTVKILEEVIDSTNYEAVFFDAESFLDEDNTSDEKLFLNNYNRSKSYGEHSSGQSLFTTFYLNKEYFPSACLYLIKREFLQRSNLYFKKDIIHEDELFTTTLMTKLGPSFHLKEPLYLRRIRPGSITTSDNHKKKIYSLNLIIEDLNSIFKDTQFINDKAKNAFQSKLSDLVASFIMLCKENKIKISNESIDFFKQNGLMNFRNNIINSFYPLYKIYRNLR